ncbi:hypothetical protein ACFY0A_28000 [Streptomyces sp. NPDC001698]|uniref:hypothetical protein n=1 Tax=Streptomyces sp. NPDC001698 TaxID=3364601 RepID=UPI0036BDF6F6
MRTAAAAAAAADPGCAQLFVGAWLRSDVDDAASAQARLRSPSRRMLICPARPPMRNLGWNR